MATSWAKDGALERSEPFISGAASLSLTFHLGNTSHTLGVTLSEGGGEYSLTGGYDYRHVTKITVMNDGSLKLKAKTTTEILKGNRLKDKEYFFFANKKGVIYYCDQQLPR